LLASRLAETAKLDSSDSIRFLSPLLSDGFAEYRDDSFIRLLDPERTITDSIRSFWPDLGPQWDSLAISSSRQLFLIEAKSHIPELISRDGCGASPQSRAVIEAAFDAVQRYCGIRKPVSWLGDFYQHANRLAHLYWLRVVQRRPAHLAYVLFTNDTEQSGPASAAEWRGAISLMQASMRLGRHRLQPFIHYVFLDVSDLNRSA
jgi:hypothetical protein